MKNIVIGAIFLLAAFIILIAGNLGLNINMGNIHLNIDGNPYIPAKNNSYISNGTLISIYEEFDNVEFVDLNIERGDLKVISGEKLSIKGDNVTESRFHITCTDNKLSLEENSSSLPIYGNSSYILTIPAKLPPVGITINCMSGTVRFDDIKATEIIFNVGKGSLEGLNLTADQLVVDAGMGSVNLHQLSAREFDIKSGLGSVNMSCKVEEDGIINIDSPVGSINLTLNNNPSEFYFDLAKRSSSINIDGEKAAGYKYYGDNDNEHKYGLTIGSGLGSVEIRFEERSLQK